MKMREYAFTVTIILSGLLASLLLACLTRADAIELIFMAMIVGLLVGVVFLLITEPKKKKAHWETAGADDELSVMVMGRNRKR